MSIIPDIYINEEPLIKQQFTKLYLKSFPSKYRERISKLNKKYKFKYNQGRLLILLFKNNLIGFILYYIKKDKYNCKRLHIDYITIDNEYNGKGYSRLILNHLINKYKNKIDTITLECEDKLIKYYQKLGYTKYKCKKICKILNIKWNLMYIKFKQLPKFNIIYNELYNKRIFIHCKYCYYIYFYIFIIKYIDLYIHFNYYHLIHHLILYQ